MPKNRCIRNLPKGSLDCAKYESSTSIPDQLIESSDDDCKQSNFNKKQDQFSISSASSLGWSDDAYESAASQRIFKDLEDVDKILQGKKSVPNFYDPEEFYQWSKYFPNLRILKPEPPVTDQANNADCLLNLKIKSVISKLYENVSNNLISTSQTPNLEEKPNEDTLHSLNIKFEPRLRERERRMSTRSMFNRQLSLEEEPDQFISLPFLEVENICPDLKNAPKNRNQRKKLEEVTLPPILNNYRSVSATPRQQSKGLAALSAKLEQNGSRYEIAKFIFSNK